uniref:Retrovirus-related Pol polyprotein from type-1 retrotransposable element R1 n=1 Tax=Melanaphis sacchari TaxID=742174 RepID=A0A2H8TW17_9HEMI
MKKLGGQNPAASSKGRESVIVDALFPASPVTDWNLAPSSAVHNIFQAFDSVLNTLEFTRVIPEFRPEVLSRAVRRLTPGKAAGPSEIPNEILRAVALAQTCAVLRIFNDCLEALMFLPRWKRARLVLLRKSPDKPSDAPSSYRPICMCDAPEKLLERLLLQRLEDHLDAHGGWIRAPNQFGFRRGVSTESAIGTVLCIAAQAVTTPRRKSLCVLVTLDVRNAFNSLGWTVIDAALRGINTPEYLVEILRSWLADGTLLTGEEMVERPVTCGVPQGSVLSPALWNLTYDSLLKMETPPGMQLVGFADDLAVVGMAVTGQQLEEAINPTLTAIDD